MLESFKVKNFKNFKEEVGIDFADRSDYHFNEEIIKSGLMTKIGIFGPNASGKSNFGFALFDITLHLVDKVQDNQQISLISYLNADSTEDVAHFSYRFRFDDDIVLYQYAKKNPKQLTFEELYLNDEKIFSFNFMTMKRDTPHLDLVGAQSLQFPKNEMNISVLRYIAHNANIGKDSAVKKVMDFVGNMLFFRSVYEGISFIGYRTTPEEMQAYIIDNGLVQKFEKHLKEAEVDVNLDVITGPIGNKILVTRHQNNHVLPFWDTSSSGTKALMLFFYWSTHFSDVPFVYIDEFDAFYHHRLAETIIRKMVENKNLQLIFTSHNTALMSNALLRPDCYFQLANNRLVSLPHLTERVIREGNNLEKLYRQGEFNE